MKREIVYHALEDINQKKECVRYGLKMDHLIQGVGYGIGRVRDVFDVHLVGLQIKKEDVLQYLIFVRCTQILVSAHPVTGDMN